MHLDNTQSFFFISPSSKARVTEGVSRVSLHLIWRKRKTVRSLKCINFVRRFCCLCFSIVNTSGSKRSDICCHFLPKLRKKTTTLTEFGKNLFRTLTISSWGMFNKLPIISRFGDKKVHTFVHFIVADPNPSRLLCNICWRMWRKELIGNRGNWTRPS